ncbi:MAG: DUF6259 domain-containing protein [Verrucomicrobiia bacterium]
MKYMMICSLVLGSVLAAAHADVYTLKDQKVEVAIDAKGNLLSLKNLQTGHDYASGKPLWRLYFDRKDGQKENEVVAPDNAPVIRQQDNRIELSYEKLKTRGGNVHMKLTLTVRLEDGRVRFGSKISNEEPHTIIRELHYPLVGDCRLPAGHRLLTTQRGGQLFPDPRKQILAAGNNPPYAAPSQFYRQMDLKYPGPTSANCFALVGATQGLYLASHDPTFQDTWHGLRVYPDASGAWTALETGLYKYPNCMKGQSWSCDANIIAPYSGSWHQTSKLYRKWADTWWRQREVPPWVRRMKSWQRIIFTHQYGEQFFTFADLNGRIRKAGSSVGVENVLAFGWWKAGMDNGYPDSYWVTDAAQGGDKAWAGAIEDFRKKGGRLMLYFNGKLIDSESAFYRDGDGKNVCYHDNTGAYYTEQYRFKGLGTFTGYYNARTFVVADTRRESWRKWLLRMADRAISFGVDSVFYDQLGYGEAASNWDLSGEFPVPNTRVIADKADTLKMIHDYLDTKTSPDFALGTEHFTDVTAQHVDYIHNITGATGPTDFTEWVRYTFPEVVLSEREIRDDTDIPRRVNHAVLKGLRNDIEIYRCRDLIDKTPTYQRYLAQVNKLKDKHADLLLLGRYKDTDGFVNQNPKVDARCFINGNRMAVVATQVSLKPATTCIRVPGYSFLESSTLGDVKLDDAPDGGKSVRLGQHGLAILVYQKTNSTIAPTDQQLRTKADEAWRAAWDRFYDDRTHLFYDFVCSYDPAKRLAALPTSKETSQQFPNPNGWGTGMEDCAISGGLMMSMVCDRFAVTGDPKLRTSAKKIFDGLALLGTLSPSEGFVIRGVCPSDKQSHYCESSRDQYTWHVYGLWRYYHSPLCQPAEKAAIRKIITAICSRLERNVVAANNYCIGKETGTFDGLVDKMWETLAHEIARLPMIYAIGADVTGDSHWANLARRYSPEAAVKSKEQSTKIPYALLQQQTSLEVLYQLEKSPELKKQWLEAMLLVADRAKVFFTKCLKYQPPTGNAVWFDWRAWGFHKSAIYKVPNRPEAILMEDRTIREPAEAALVQLLCPQPSLTPEQLALVKQMIAQVDYDKVVFYGHYYTQAVYWRAVRCGLLKP